MLTALADGALLAEKTGATPPTVVALHGWMRTGADFAAIVSGLDAVSIHLPGMGVTPEPPEAWGTERYAEAVADAIEGFGPVILVGHSFGGRVAVRLAASRPNLVRGVVLTGVPLVRLTAAKKPALGFRIVRSLAKAKLVPQSVLEKQRRKHGSADYLAARGVMRDILVRTVGENYDDDLRRLSTPVRMVWGENDTAAPADAGRAAAAMVRGARFRVVPGAGHLLDGELRTAVREELTAMIEETEA
ncbi:alpha/beta hydrolase [Glaciihabitans arcticus]|uniref:Alpha/beta hydrolase n=1 Tax=Glaciihabitans arcticus TaxID=2668039 RepID=A0A4Q9GR76_9MICO|nr:alpha/beta hydrolase [Glaciihabitans arcticus]TBN56088.1 alpha/beta hydrolase [Glaciihabitans arcticus]